MLAVGEGASKDALDRIRSLGSLNMHHKFPEQLPFLGLTMLILIILHNPDRL
jgi:hypothetical protein